MSQSTAARLRRDVAHIIFGPWPLRPWMVFLVVFSMNVYAMNNFAGMGYRTVSDVWMETIPAALAIASAGGLTEWACKAVARRFTGDEVTRAQYVASIVVTGFVLGGVTYVNLLAFDLQALHVRGLLYYIGRGTVALAGVHTILGLSDARLVSHIRRAEAALDEVRSQRRVIIDAEERARGTVARFLHDQVQASLVAITLQLRSISERIPELQRAQIGSVVQALEELRGIDVRAASRRLSPDLAAIGLEQALTDALSTYADSMQIQLHLDGSLQEWSRPRQDQDRQSLATYRIVEQAALNAAVHGRARSLRIDITRERDVIEVRVADDGVGLASSEVVPGSGLRVIGAWTDVIRGQWQLVPGSPVGTVLTVTFPITRALTSRS